MIIGLIVKERAVKVRFAMVAEIQQVGNCFLFSVFLPLIDNFMFTISSRIRACVGTASFNQYVLEKKK
jgi:hypothetical protein